MKNEIAVFQNSDLGSVRTLAIDGEPWFVGKDVAERLGYSNPRKALADHADEEDKGVTKCDTPGGTQEMTIINESGLYSLILSSKLTKAKAFKRWITSEVIPAIRKTGAYRTGPDTESLIHCAEIMAACLPENKPQVIKILGQIVPGLDSPEVAPAPTVTRCPEKFCRDRFNTFLDQRSITNGKLGALLGVSPGLVSKWRNGVCSPSTENRSKLCAALGVPEGHFNVKKRRQRP